MAELSKLVILNQPDLIIFIGEALVGNDGIDQLVSFNKSLIDRSDPDKIRQVDAIIVSKFDTVDDKGMEYFYEGVYLFLVGAALSMTYLTGKPILYVGVG